MPTSQQPAVRIERTISAPPGRVYRAWLEPELIRRWMAPGEFRVESVDVEERVGGRYQVRHRGVGGFVAEIVELVRDERIAWRWGFAGPEGANGPVYDSLLTVTFAHAPGGATRLILVHERLDALAEALPEVARNVRPGWEDVLAKLAATEVLEDPVAQELLHSPLLTRLAYNGSDGFPRVVPIGYLWKGGQFIICTLPNAPKTRALRRDPRVGLTIDRDAMPPTILLVRGIASLEIVEGVPAEYLEASRKAVSEEQMPSFEAQVRALYQQMVRISIRPTWAKVIDFETRLPQSVEEAMRALQPSASS